MIGFWVVVILGDDGTQYPDLGSVPSGEVPCIAVVRQESMSREPTSRDVLMMFDEFDDSVGDTPEFRLHQSFGVARLLNSQGFTEA